MAFQNPVVFIPGIMGSTLRDEYPVDPETIWSVLRNDESRTALHPDDLRYELIEPARIESDSVFKLIYGDIIAELRTELSSKTRQTPVFPFPYDWRIPLADTVERLEAFVNEVIGRSGLLRHYHKDGFSENPKVDIVAHSMGGLVTAGLLARAGRNARIGKVVTIATPFRGSLEAPVKAVTGTADIGEMDPNPRDRFTARLTPALYHLLPGFDGAVTAQGDIPTDLFSTDAWQPTVFKSIADALQLHGRAPASTRAGRLKEAENLLKLMLDKAREFRNGIESLDLTECAMTVDDWLCVVGVDETTRVRLPIQSERGKPVFYIRSVDRMNAWNEPDDEKRIQTGDGTVPFMGARCAFIPLEKIVCIRPHGFGYWELRDRALRHVAGFHAMLPTMNLIHRLSAAFLLNEPKRKGIGGWRPPGVSASEWKPPIKDLADRDLT